MRRWGRWRWWACPTRSGARTWWRSCGRPPVRPSTPTSCSPTCASTWRRTRPRGSGSCSTSSRSPGRARSRSTSCATCGNAANLQPRAERRCVRPGLLRPSPALPRRARPAPPSPPRRRTRELFAASRRTLFTRCASGARFTSAFGAGTPASDTGPVTDTLPSATSHPTTPPETAAGTGADPRFDWSVEEAEALIAQPFHDLLADAQQVHRRRFDPHVVEAAILLSIKTGAGPEDCAYCPQSAMWNTDLGPEPLMDTDSIVESARAAKANGATRFCMGAAWRSPTDRQVDRVADAVRAVGDLGLKTCVTLGMVTTDQADTLADAGLDFYNHNLDTSPEFYGEVITSRTYDDRLETLANLRTTPIKLCTGGIVGMGESRRDRAGLLAQLASLDPHPESVPINLLVKVPGTPLGDLDDFDGLELVRTIAAARIMMPTSVVRLSAGRNEMTDELQALCLHAGASSVFLGDKLLTTGNPGEDRDRELFEKLDTDAGCQGTSVDVK